MFEDQRLLSGLRAQDKDALRRIYEKYIDDLLRTGKEIRFRFGSSEDKAGKEAKRRPTGW